MKLLSIVFSFRNEQSNLEELVKRTSESLKKLNNWNFELIFVNDDSTDSSEKTLIELQNNVNTNFNNIFSTNRWLS